MPQMLGCDDDLRVLEMSIVKRPFVLDFCPVPRAAARLRSLLRFATEGRSLWRALPWAIILPPLGGLERAALWAVKWDLGAVPERARRSRCRAADAPRAIT